MQQFQRAAGNGGNDSLAVLFIAGTELDMENFDSCLSYSEALLNVYPRSVVERRRLAADVQAKIWVANTLAEICRFMKNAEAISDKSGCSIDAGAIGSTESGILERIFLRAARKKASLISDARRGDQFALGCLAAAFHLQRATCGSTSLCGEGGCYPGESIVPPATLIDYGVIPRIDLPPVSQNLSLGRVLANGDIAMEAVRPILQTRQIVSLDEFGVERLIEFTREVENIETVIMPAGEKPAPNRYRKYTPAAEAAPAPAAEPL